MAVGSCPLVYYDSGMHIRILTSPPTMAVPFYVHPPHSFKEACGRLVLSLGSTILRLEYIKVFALGLSCSKEQLDFLEGLLMPCSAAGLRGHP